MRKRIFRSLSLALLCCFSVILLQIPAQALANDNETAKVKSVNFIQEGEVSKLIIDLDRDVFAERTHIKDDKQIILDLKNVDVAPKFLRGIDTSEFSGSAVLVSPYKKPGTKNDLRFAIQLRDNVRSFIEKKRKRIILHIENRFGVFSKTKLAQSGQASVKASLEEASNQRLNIPKSTSVEDILENLTQSGMKKYIGKRISINVNNLGYRELLRMIAETSGFNIIIDDQINSLKPLTLNLTNIPWDQALDTVMSLGNLVAEKHSNILTIKTAKQVLEEKRRELENRNTNVIQEPLVTKVFPISFADLKEITTILESYKTPERGSIQTDTRTSNVIVKDTVEVIERMKRIIQTLDTQTPQVLIESKIVEANENYEFRAGLSKQGLKFGFDPISPSSNLGANEGSFIFSSAPDSEDPGVLSASISVYKRLTGLNFSLELMESESKGRIISSPKVITQNNMPAEIKSNDSRNLLTATVSNGVSQQQVQELTSGVELKVTPRVTNDGSISMQVEIKKSGFIEVTTGGLPNQVGREIKTNVLVGNGSTVVIGGLYQTENTTIDSGIPFLKDLPLIGWLFRNAYNPKRIRSEMMVFLTPRIVNQEEAGLVESQLNEIGI